VHVSNRHLDLVPVVAGLARRDRFGWVEVRSATDEQSGATGSHWIVLTRNQRLLQNEILLAAGKAAEGRYVQAPLWTDDYNNLLMVLK
jgi:hypothetical protein